MRPLSRICRLLLPPGSRRDKIVWLAGLSLWKMREGPGPWLRAMRRGIFQALPERTRTRIVKSWSGGLPCSSPATSSGLGFDLERPGLVTVVLPVYNHAEFLESSIQSVLSQTCPNFELIIIDDGSTDDIDAVLARVVGDPRIRILRQENLKLPRALSNGFLFASGQFRTWTSADNEMGPTQLAVLVECLERDPCAGMVYSDYIVIDEHGDPLIGSTFRPQNRRSPRSAEVRLPRDCSVLNVIQDNFIGPSFLYRATVGRCAGDYAPVLGVEDHDYWMRIRAEFGIRHLGTNETLYRYRWHENTLNARAKEIRLFQVGKELMKQEANRSRWRSLPWNTGDKQLVEIQASSTDRCLPPEKPNTYVAIHWGPDPQTPFDRPSFFGHDRVGHFTAHPEVANVLALFSDQVWITPEDESRNRLVVACANERVHYLLHHSPTDRHRLLPRVWHGDTHPTPILLQIDELPPESLEHRILPLAEELRARFFAPMLAVCKSDTDVIQLAGENNLTLHCPRQASEYATLLTELQVRLVCSYNSLFGAAQADHLGIPFVQVLDSPGVDSRLDEIRLFRQADRHTHAYLCGSADTAHYNYHRMGLDLSKMLIAPNAVDCPRPTGNARRRIRAEFGIPEKDFLLLEVAPLCPSNSQRYLLRALARARAREAGDLQLILLGKVLDLPYLKLLRQDLTKFGLEGAVRIVQQDHPRDDFYAAADCFVLPSLWGGCNSAVMEAMCSGLPCVLSDVGAAREQQLHGEGRLLPPPIAPVTKFDHQVLPAAAAALPEPFIEELTAALEAESALGQRRVRTAPALRAFGMEGWSIRLECVLRWFMQGGNAVGARPWFRRAYEVSS